MKAREYTEGERAIREQIRKESAELDKALGELEKRHRQEKAVIKERREALQVRCPHFSTGGGPGVWACHDCKLTEIDR